MREKAILHVDTAIVEVNELYNSYSTSLSAAELTTLTMIEMLLVPLICINITPPRAKDQNPLPGGSFGILRSTYF